MSRPRQPNRFLRYPRGRLLAVIDSVGSAEAAAREVAGAGIPPDRVEILHGDAAAAAFDGTGHHHGGLARVRRLVEFVTMDQAPDLAWYEAAVRSGRAVISVRPEQSDQIAVVVRILQDRGAHFINHFGLISTEEFARWRGPEPAVPEWLKR